MLTTVSSCAPSTPLASSLPLFVLIGPMMTGMTGTNELQYIHILIQVHLAGAGCKVQQSKQHHQSVPKQGMSSFQMSFLCTLSLKLSWTNFCFSYLWSTPDPGWEWEGRLTSISKSRLCLFLFHHKIQQSVLSTSMAYTFLSEEFDPLEVWTHHHSSLPIQRHSPQLPRDVTELCHTVYQYTHPWSLPLTDGNLRFNRVQPKV